jgi:hypothetical protein
MWSPVKAYINMITLIPAENESPAFCILKGKLLVPVTYYLFQNVLRKLIKEIGEDPKQYSSQVKNFEFQLKEYIMFFPHMYTV